MVTFNPSPLTLSSKRYRKSIGDQGEEGDISEFISFITCIVKEVSPLKRLLVPLKINKTEIYTPADPNKLKIKFILGM